MKSVIIDIFVLLSVTKISIQQSQLDQSLYFQYANSNFNDDFKAKYIQDNFFEFSKTECMNKCNQDNDCFAFNYKMTYVERFATNYTNCELMKSSFDIENQLYSLNGSFVYIKFKPTLTTTEPSLIVNKLTNGYNLTWSADTQNGFFTKFTRYIVTYSDNNRTEKYKMNDFKLVDFDCLYNDFYTENSTSAEYCQYKCTSTPDCKHVVFRWNTCFMKNRNFTSTNCYNYNQKNYRSYIISDETPIPTSIIINNVNTTSKFGFTIQLYDSIQNVWTLMSKKQIL